MFIGKREATIVLDYVHGKSQTRIASEHDISIQRVNQIVTKVLHQLGCSGKNVTPQDVGLRLVRHRSFVHQNSPEAFYYFERWWT